MHVRGFTRIAVERRGASGHVPGRDREDSVFEIAGRDGGRVDAGPRVSDQRVLGDTHNRAHNYWGYDPMAFFAPHRGYAAGSEPGCQVNEFKQMVRALHQAGIEVILDVVFNHTAEGNELGPTFSFKGLENQVYYMLETAAAVLRNYSGCGNTVNGNHPIVREMIFLCLRHWVHNYHVDGFRFDLASILSRDRNGELVPNPPLVEAIAEDPLLADTQGHRRGVGRGRRLSGRLVRHSCAGPNGTAATATTCGASGAATPGMTGHLATRAGRLQRLVQPGGRQPYHSINFITSHDGFTLNDLVTYAQKHNEANGEGNRDGDNNNYSANYGVEGPTRRRTSNGSALRQIKNMLATLLLEPGRADAPLGRRMPPDAARQQQRLLPGQRDLLVRLEPGEKQRGAAPVQPCADRLSPPQPTVRRASFLTGKPSLAGEIPDVSWYGPDGAPVHWDHISKSLICMLGASGLDDPDARHVLFFIHAGPQPQEFVLPVLAGEIRWKLFIDTYAATPHDVYPEADGPAPSECANPARTSFSQVLRRREESANVGVWCVRFAHKKSRSTTEEVMKRQFYPE